MYPFRHRTIFKNRWFALLWAAGIIWWALDVANSSKGTAPEGNEVVASNAQGEDGAGESYSDKDVNQLQQELQQL